MRLRWKIALCVAAALATGTYLASQYWYYLPGIMASIKDPVGPNRPVTWAAAPAAVADAAQARPPNIILIVADDLGYNDITFNGGGVANGAVPTPNIDGIAKAGVNFSRGYASHATCSPARAAMMTGRFPTRFGFEFTPTSKLHSKISAWEDKRERIAPWPVIYRAELEQAYDGAAMEIPQSEIMLPKLLRSKGYRTLGLGKWHLGDSPASRPEARGFDEYLGFYGGGSLYLPKDDPNAVRDIGEHYPPEKFLWANLPFSVRFNGGSRFAPSKYMTDYLADEAAKAIAANKNRPFFLYVGFNAPHTPLQALKSDYDSLSSISDHRLRVYAAMIKALDRGVGTVLDAVRAQGIEDNTIVIFTSDNGGAGAAGLPDLNKPFRGWKATFFEGGIRAPLFLKWPAKVKPSIVSSGAAGHVDIFATAAAAAGVAMPSDRKMDGVDLVAIAGRASFPDRALFWRSGDYSALLQGDLKIQRLKRPDKTWLFNLKDDPTERSNLASTDSSTLARMSRMLETMNAEQARPLWPSLLEAPVLIDKPFNGNYSAKDEYIYWAN